jgi:hypothetical protein
MDPARLSRFWSDSKRKRSGISCSHEHQTKRATIREFKEALDRALSLYDLFVTQGGHRNAARGNLASRQGGCGTFLFPLGGVGPPRTSGGSFHEANGGDEGLPNAECRMPNAE